MSYTHTHTSITRIYFLIALLLQKIFGQTTKMTRIRWQYNTHKDMKNNCATWIGKCDGKVSLARTRRRWK